MYNCNCLIHKPNIIFLTSNCNNKCFFGKETESFEHIAKEISPAYDPLKWSRSAIIKAIQNKQKETELLQTNNKPELLKLISSIPFLGFKTPQHPESLDYNFLKNIVFLTKMDNFMTMLPTPRELHALSLLGLCENDTVLSRFIYHKTSSPKLCCSNSDKFFSPSKIEEISFAFKTGLSKWCQENKHLAYNIIHPTTQEEAIVLSATLFRFNTIYATCSICEYYYLLAAVLAKSSSYSPISFEVKYLKCPTYYDMRVVFVQNGNLSKNILPDNELYQILKNYGFNITQTIQNKTLITSDDYPASGILNQKSKQRHSVAFETPIQALEYANTQYSVVKGYHPSCDNTHSPISLDELEFVNSTDIISFGIENEKLFIAYTISDFVDSLMATRTFALHTDSKTVYLTKRNINSLKNLYYDNKKLIDAINICEMRNGSITSHGEELEQATKNSTELNQTIELFNIILHLGMYMRGWKASDNTRVGGSKAGKYPLKSIDTNYTNPDAQNEIDTNVTLEIQNYEQKISSIQNSELRRLIKSAPLLKHSTTPQKELVFFPTVNSDQGFTLEDRINIVKSGEDGSIYSCMRMSSNFIITSAYYYLSTVFLFPPSFDLRDLNEIM